MAEANLTPASLRQSLQYDSVTGKFSRIGCPDEKVGRVATKGHLQISVASRRYMAHRLAWFYIHGIWPDGQIDHKNQVKTDNRIDNLRIVSNKQNAENVTMFKHNKSGRRGVRFLARANRWVAEIKHHKRNQHLGLFDNIIDAVAARMQAERLLFTHAPEL